MRCDWTDWDRRLAGIEARLREAKCRRRDVLGCAASLGSAAMLTSTLSQLLFAAGDELQEEAPDA